MSLLAAFVAILRIQWMDRYLRHTGGSIVERCGDRQRKFDCLMKWPFQLFINSVPLMLQIALLLLMCGLSQYTRSVNTSVGYVVISLTVLGALFYIVVVVSGTSSYECPFQTPASIGLRRLGHSWIIWRLLASLSPSNVIYTTRKNTRRGLASASHHIYATWRDIRRGVVSVSRRVYEIARSVSSWEISPSRIRSGICNMATKVGHRTIILLLRIDRTVGNAKQRLVQGFGRTGLLPTTTRDVHRRPLVPRNAPGLLVGVRNLEALWWQNTHHARCVSWFIRNITDPEALDFAIRFAGTIRWFDGNSDYDPPFDFIVSTFEACFDSTNQLYPGMGNRAYYSARAILQINARARTKSHELTSRYPLPFVSSDSVQHADPDLRHIIRMFERNYDYGYDYGKPTLDFPKGTNTHAHILWMSTLFVDLTRVDPNPTLSSYKSYLNVAVTNHRAAIANTLLMWYMFLGGHVEEETFWAVDKSYAVVSSSFLSFNPLKIVSPRDSLEIVLHHLSTEVMNIIANGNDLQRLDFLLEFLAAWEKRPVWLTPMAYQWYSAISEHSKGREGFGQQAEGYFDQPESSDSSEHRLRPQNLAHSDILSELAEGEFSGIGPGRDLVHMGDISNHTHRHPQDKIPFHYRTLLSRTLEIGFRLVRPGREHPTLDLNHKPHHKLALEIAFSSDDDEVIADAVSIWIVGGGDHAPLGSFARHFAKRVERCTPFSPRLRRTGTRAIERTWHGELEVSRLETIRLLNRLDVGADDMEDEYTWVRLLVDVIRLPAGLESLSSHYWRLLGELPLAMDFETSESPDVEVMTSLEKAEDWEKLEVWMVVVWQSLPLSPPAAVMEDIERVTLELLLRRPSALLRFEALRKRVFLYPSHKPKFQQACNQARAEQLLLEPPPYVSARPVRCLYVLMSPSFFCFSQVIYAQPLVPLPFAGDEAF
jgi:hypothetical protein